jgi:hypothetical protein
MNSIAKPGRAWLVASGDLRLSANRMCWPEQAKMEASLAKAFKVEGREIVRAHPYDEKKQHGFIDSQRMGLEVFRTLDPDVPVVVAESVWQYSHHVLGGLFTHRGPILTVANWSGRWPGLVGLLNLNASLAKMGVRYSTLWSETFSDPFFTRGLRQWLAEGMVVHDESHVKDFDDAVIPGDEETEGRRAAVEFRKQKAIMGVFDEGCMGMFNAIIPDEMLNGLGVFKERLSQSSLYAAMQLVPDAESSAALDWLLAKGMKFNWGKDEETELTRSQTLEQCKMYIAAVRMADEFGCDTIGIQYQQGLKDLVPASDLAEGLLNNADRPPVACARNGRILYENQPLPHFNEVDECAGLDALVTHRLWNRLGFPSENTLHDLRWGQHFKGEGIDDYVWVLLISGAVPPAHLIGGYSGAVSERQPPMYFRLGGGTIKGISRPGHIVWSRVFVKDNQLHCDLGVARVVELPQHETESRWRETTPQWPIMHAVFDSITRDQMMARHKSNHIQVVYAPDAAQAKRACRIKAVMLAELGLQVHFCGNVT